MSGILFRIIEDFNAKGEIPLKEITSLFAQSYLFRRPHVNYEDPKSSA